MGQVDPKFNFDFDVIEKGTYAFVIKETNVELEGTGKKSGKRYWARCVVEGGDQDGLSHLESFFEKTKDDFSFSKMAGFLYKVGMLKTLGKVDTSIFLSPEFEERFKKQLPGKKLGAKIGHQTKDKDGKLLDNVRSTMQAYYTYDEVRAILGKKGAIKNAETPATASAPEPIKSVPNPLWD